MSTDALSTEESRSKYRSLSTAVRSVRMTVFTGVLLSLTAVEPVFAQSVGESFCTTDMAETVRNLFSIIQFGGPLIGGTLFLGATVATPAVRRTDLKKEIIELRNQALIWGVIVAPLATVILQFLLNNVVAGGASCGF